VPLLLQHAGLVQLPETVKCFSKIILALTIDYVPTEHQLPVTVWFEVYAIHG